MALYWDTWDSYADYQKGDLADYKGTIYQALDNISYAILIPNDSPENNLSWKIWRTSADYRPYSGVSPAILGSNDGFIKQKSFGIPNWGWGLGLGLIGYFAFFRKR